MLPKKLPSFEKSLYFQTLTMCHHVSSCVIMCHHVSLGLGHPNLRFANWSRTKMVGMCPGATNWSSSPGGPVSPMSGRTSTVPRRGCTWMEQHHFVKRTRNTVQTKWLPCSEAIIIGPFPLTQPLSVIISEIFPDLLVCCQARTMGNTSMPAPMLGPSPAPQERFDAWPSSKEICHKSVTYPSVN